jgi:hypothetical protein
VQLPPEVDQVDAKAAQRASSGRAEEPTLRPTRNAEPAHGGTNSASGLVRGSGGCGIRTREGLPPTRFPSPLCARRQRSQVCGATPRTPGSVSPEPLRACAIETKTETTTVTVQRLWRGGPLQMRGRRECAACGAERLVVGPLGSAETVCADDDLAEHECVTALRASPSSADQSRLLHRAIMCSSADGPQAFVPFTPNRSPRPCGQRAGASGGPCMATGDDAHPEVRIPIRLGRQLVGSQRLDHILTVLPECGGLGTYVAYRPIAPGSRLQLGAHRPTHHP